MPTSAFPPMYSALLRLYVSQVPQPKVFLAVPLECLERTTIGFRLQKLELHFNLHGALRPGQVPVVESRLADWNRRASTSSSHGGSGRGVETWAGLETSSRGISEQWRFFKAQGGIGGPGIDGDRHEGARVSVVLMTRARCEM